MGRSSTYRIYLRGDMNVCTRVSGKQSTVSWRVHAPTETTHLLEPRNCSTCRCQTKCHSYYTFYAANGVQAKSFNGNRIFPDRFPSWAWEYIRNGKMVSLRKVVQSISPIDLPSSRCSQTGASAWADGFGLSNVTGPKALSRHQGPAHALKPDVELDDVIDFIRHCYFVLMTHVWKSMFATRKMISY